MKKLIKSILFSFLRILAPALGKRGSILMYHSIEQNSAFFTVSPENFEKQLKFLVKKKYRVVKLSALFEALESKKSIANYVVITFDDGYRDNFLLAYPLLKKYNLSATIFVATKQIGGEGVIDGKKVPILGREDIKNMYKDGLIEFMPHTASHVRLSTISLSEAIQEVESSRVTLEDITGAQANILAYPWGMYTNELIQYIKTRWRGGVTVKEGLVTKESDTALLPRNAIDSATTFSQFKGKVTGAIALYAGIKKTFNG